MNHQLTRSLTAFFLSLCSLLLLLFLFAFFSFVIKSQSVSDTDLFLDITTQMAPEVSLSPLPFAASGMTLSSDIELEPIFIAPNWREPLPTVSKTPTMKLIASPTPTIEATLTVTLAEFSSETRESHTTATATAKVTTTPRLDTSLINPRSDITVTEEVSVANVTLTASVTVLPEQRPSPTQSPTHSPTQPPPPPTILPTATATTTLIPPSPSEVPTAPPATLLPSSNAPPHVLSISDLTYEAMFQHIGAQYDIDWRLLASIAYSESSLNAGAVGKDGEQGLMQILPSTWDEFAPKVGVSDPFDPVSNVQVGAAYLAYVRDQLIRKGYAEEYWALVAYNWGPNNLARLLQQDGNWGGIPIMRQDYAYNIIERITASNYEWLKKKLQKRVY